MKKIAPGLIVDGFTIKEENHAYFLTHWHADHYMGIANKWPYGPIYASVITRKILLTKYPKLKQTVIGLELGVTRLLTNPKTEQQIKVTLFDANHMAGSVMYLFQLEDGQTILHTGDMRFNAKLLKKLTGLFERDPINPELYRCKYQIDKLYLDNTYCDPIFQFPNRSDAIAMAKQIIDKNKERINRVYLITHSIGKQQALLAFSMHYGTKVIVCEERLEYIKQIFDDRALSFFGTDEKQGWIQVIKPHQKQLITKHDRYSLVITLTGWANLRDYHQFSQNEYIVPYSLHSNYQELELFMSVVRPKKLYPVVNHNDLNKSSDFRNTIHSYQSYFNSLMHMKQRGFEFFQKEYVLPLELSKEQEIEIEK